MDQINDLADARLISGCLYCGGPEETRDHVPSRVLLEPPFPENLPVVWACASCNRGFSLDEEYFACLVESAIVGSTDPDLMRRPGIARILRRSLALRARIETARTTIDGQARFGIEPDRFRNVILKLARGHAAYELSQAFREEPNSVWWTSLAAMTDEHRNDFDASHVIGPIGEIGSRQSQRPLVTQITLASASGEELSLGLLVNDWVDVQDGFYRYLAIDEGDSITVKIIIREYLACEVSWTR